MLTPRPGLGRRGGEGKKSPRERKDIFFLAVLPSVPPETRQGKEILRVPDLIRKPRRNKEKPEREGEGSLLLIVGAFAVTLDQETKYLSVKAIIGLGREERKCLITTGWLRICRIRWKLPAGVRG